MTNLDEALSLLICSNKHEEFTLLAPLRNSISNFLTHIDEKYKHASSEVRAINWKALELKDGLMLNAEKDKESLIFRRKILDGLLKVDNWDWDDIYPEKVLKKGE